MAGESKVLVRLRLLGADLMARDAKKASSGLKDIDKSARRANTGLGTVNGGRVQSQLSLIERGTLRAKKGLKGVEAQAITAGKALKTAGAAAGVLAATGLVAGIKASANFEQTMANVHAKLVGEKGLDKAMPKLSALALKLGRDTQFSGQQAAAAMDELAAQGFTTNQIMGVLPGTLSLAAASGTDLATAATIQTETLHGFGLAAGQAGRVADVLAQTANRSAANIDDMQESIKYIAPVAKASGQSLEDMLAAVGLMSNVGIKGSQAGTTLRTALVRLANPTNKARGALADLGLKAGDLAGKKGLLSMPNILGKIVKGSQGVSKNTRNAALATIFGREALSGMVALVEKGPKKFDAMSGALERSKGAAKRAADIMRNTVKGSWDNFTGSVETAAITLLQRFQPAIKNSLNRAAGWINDATTAVGKFGTALAGTQPHRTVTRAAPGVTGGGAARTEQAPVAGATAAGMNLRARLAPVIGWLQTQMSKLGKVFLSAGKQLLDAFKPAMPFLSNVLVPLLKGIAIGVIGSVVAAFKVLVPVIKILATVLGFVGKVAAPFKGIIQGIGVVIGFLAAGPILKLLGGIGKIGIVFRIAGVPMRVLSGLLRGLGGVLGIAFSAMGRLAGAFVRGAESVRRFLGFGGRISRTVSNMMGSVMNAVGNLPGAVARLVKGVGGKLISGISNSVRSKLGGLVSFFGRVGGRIVSAIVGAFRALPGQMMSILGTVVDQLPVPGFIKGKIKDFLGAHANGGTVRAPLQLVGERGPELARLPVGTQITPAGPTSRMLREANQPPAMLPTPGQGPLVAHLVVNLDGKKVHEGVHRVERQLQEAR